MENSKVNSAVQELIIRLQDAETGYYEISRNTTNEIMRLWMEKYAKERHSMHKELEAHMKVMGGNPEVTTSILGELHKLFINIKLNSFFDNYDSIINEVERGATTLIEDYDKVIREVSLPTALLQTVLNQKSMIERELQTLKDLQERLNAVEA